MVFCAILGFIVVSSGLTAYWDYFLGGKVQRVNSRTGRRLV